MKATIASIFLLVAPTAFASDWYTLLDGAHEVDAPQCVESGGPIMSGPVAELYEYKPAEDEHVIIAYAKSTGNIGGVYFLGRAACVRHAKKYALAWAKQMWPDEYK